MADFVIKPTTGNLKIQDDQDVDRIVIAPTTGVTTLSNPTLTAPTITDLSNVTGTLPVGVTGGSGLNALITGSNYFLVFLNNGQTISTPVNTWTDFKGATELGTHLDQNSRFTESSGRYVPVDLGYYYLFGYFSINDQSSNADRTYISIAKNDDEPTDNYYGLGIADGSTGEDKRQMSVQVILQVDNAADFIKMKAHTNAGNDREMQHGAAFGGFRIA